MVLEHWPNTSARATVTPASASRLAEDASYLLDQGYTHLAMIPVNDAPWGKDELASLQESIRGLGDLFIERHRQGRPFYFKLFDDPIKGILKPMRRRTPCGAGRGLVCVSVDGNIWPCHRFPGYDPEGTWILGNVEDGLDEDKRWPILSFDCVRDTKANCERCLSVNGCLVSCIAVNWFLNKDIYQPAPDYCRIREAAWREALRIHYVLRNENNAAFMKRYYGNGRTGERTPPEPTSVEPQTTALPRLSCGVV